MTESAERLEIIQDGEQPVTLRLRGELDAFTAPDLQRALDESGQDHSVTIDVTDLGFVDSSGLRVLVSAHAALAEAGHTLSLRSPSASLMRLLEITGLQDHLVIQAPAD